jgi:hypothetical protein
VLAIGHFVPNPEAIRGNIRDHAYRFCRRASIVSSAAFNAKCGSARLVAERRQPILIINEHRNSLDSRTVDIILPATPSCFFMPFLSDVPNNKPTDDCH